MTQPHYLATVGERVTITAGKHVGSTGRVLNIDASEYSCFTVAVHGEVENLAPDEIAPTLTKALNDYRDAVASRAYWQDNGTRRDGNLESALAHENYTRQLVTATSKSH